MGNFKKDFLSGVFYTSIAKYVGIFISVIITAILARLIPPSDFGVIAVATICINFVNLLTDFGLGPAIVQNDQLSKSDLRSLFSFTIYGGLVAGLIVYVLSNNISVYYGNAQLINVIKLLSLNILFVSANIVPNALLLKTKKFKLIAIRSLLMQISGGVIGVVMAYDGFGLYALVCQSLFSCIGIFAFNYIQTSIVPVLRIRKSALMKVFSFSAFQFMAQIFNYFTKDIDKLLIGRYTSLAGLGYYEKSYRLMQLPVGNLSYVLAPVMQPVFNEYRYDLNTMYKKYGTMLKCLSLIGFPLSVFLYFESYDLIYIVFGNQWEPAVPVFKWLALGIGFNILLSSSGPMYLVSNNVRLSFVNCIVEFLISIMCIVIGLYMGGINNVALMVSVGLLLRFCYIFAMLTCKAFHLPIKNFLSYIYIGLINSAVLFVVYYIINGLVTTDKFSLYRLIIFSSICVMTVFVPFLKLGLLKTIFK